jgi:Asp-tRNA(Asn)/Glu-tRNA(Gln) amidotransferase A subunit family amidase
MLTVDAARKAIRERNERLRALVHVLPEPLPGDPGGPLDAVPYTLKDTWDTPGIPTTGGSWRHRERVPATAAPVYDALRKTGAVLLGKSNCSDLALAWESNNHLVGPTRNPFDETRSAGGSSGGAACAVATGMAAFDWGTDFGGSIRFPASCCGVVGLRLSSEPWPVNEQHFPRLAPHFYPWVGMGPLARNLEDVRRVLAALGDLRRPFPAPAMSLDRVVVYGPDRRSAGRWPSFVSDASRVLLAAGVHFETARTLPAPGHVNTVYNGYVSSHFAQFSATGELAFAEGLSAVLLGLASLGRLDKRVHPTSGALLALMALGQKTIYRNAARWEAELANVRARMKALWDRGLLVVAPTTTSLPPRHGLSTFDWSVLAFTKLGNLVDSTAISIPFGTFDDTGLPRGLQILGPPGSEASVLSLADKLAGAGDYS